MIAYHGFWNNGLEVSKSTFGFGVRSDYHRVKSKRYKTMQYLSPEHAVDLLVRRGGGGGR
ncbi:hypothetical protein PG996_002428 [Apiospora saccharicola]|uniref:Uncharacterized protein n=1 Tax=Apiospora saccharicola TaxID=335842 RepID=A0ABR1WKX2_9PEZI